MKRFVRVDPVLVSQLAAMQQLPALHGLTPLIRFRVSMALTVHQAQAARKAKPIWNPLEVAAYVAHMALCGKFGPKQRLFQLADESILKAWQSEYFAWQAQQMAPLVTGLSSSVELALESTVLSTAMADLLHGRFYLLLLDLLTRSFDETWSTIQRLVPVFEACLAHIGINYDDLQRCAPVKAVKTSATVRFPQEPNLHASLFPLRRLPCAWMQEALTLLAANEGDDDADLVQNCPWYLLDFGDVDEIDDFSNVGLHSSTQNAKLKKTMVYCICCFVGIVAYDPFAY